jgi:putative hydrolase of the HAD superfamily
VTSPAIEAVIFDWGGTLTAWHDIDFHAESLALASAVVAESGSDESADRLAHAARLHQAGATVWGWSRDEQRSATVADLFTTTRSCSRRTTSSGSRTP